VLLEAATGQLVGELDGGQWNGALAFAPASDLLTSSCSYQGGGAIVLDQINAEGQISHVAEWECSAISSSPERFVDTIAHLAHLENWLEGTRLYVKPGSRWRHRTPVFVHLIPGLGQIPLSKLTVQPVQAFYARKLDAGMAGTTLHHLHTALRQALEQAVKLGLVPHNVTDQMKAPRRSYREIAPLTKEQARRFRERVVGDRFETLYTLALTTGMREGELLALHWQDVNLEQASLVVRMGLHRDGRPHILAETKTAHSRRKIGLTRTAVVALRAHWLRQQEERLALGPAWDAALNRSSPMPLGHHGTGKFCRQELQGRAGRGRLTEYPLSRSAPHRSDHPAQSRSECQGGQ
jgi:integrase